MYSLLVGQRSEAEEWPRPWVVHLGMQESNFSVWEVDRQVGQTDVFEHLGSFL